MKKLVRDLLRSNWFQRAVGSLTAVFLRLVWRTNRFSFDPPDVYEIVEPQMPAIFAFWHGQHFLTPFVKTKESQRVKVLISRHRDGEYNAIAAERLGIGTIRGSGDHGSAFHRKGGVGAFKEMVRALEQGYNVALTADVPKRSRIAGLGIIMLARESGRPIMPFAMVTSRYWRLKNWDRTTINLPFGRGALVGGEIIMVPADADARGHGRIARAAGGDAERRDGARLCAGRPSRRGRPMANVLPMTLRVYRRLSSVAVPLAPALIKRRLKQGKEDPARVGERRGMSADARPHGPLVWIYGASVGEVLAAAALIEKLRALNIRILLTSGTVTSAAIVAKRFPPDIIHQYVPYDSPRYVARFLDHWRPSLALFIESDLWPNLILSSAARRLPMVLINGRMSHRSFPRWRRVSGTISALLGQFDVCLAQSRVDAERFACSAAAMSWSPAI